MDFQKMIKSYRERTKLEKDYDVSDRSQEEFLYLVGSVISSYYSKEFLKLPTQLAECPGCVVMWWVFYLSW